MKKLFMTLSLAGILMSARAQTDVYLQIQHMLGDEPFAFDEAASSNLAEDFTVDRLEYYLSEITLIHDGGVETVIADSWILVNAGETVNVFLGSQDITTLESVRFGIGVDPEHNHLDPASYPSDHPLAPQLPSMHWGWASGYRFVAMEGYAGDGFSQNYQIHALGDVNYRTTEVATAGTVIDGALYVALEGDYTEAIRDISVASGLVNHSETDEAADLLWNFHDHVFREGEASVVDGLEDLQTTNIFLAPNPASTTVQIQIPDQVADGASIVLTDYNGKQLMQVPADRMVQLDISGLPAGLYLVQLVSTKGNIAWRKLYIN